MAAAKSGSVVEVTTSNVAKVKEMAKTKPVIFLVTAPAWCGACKDLDPVIHDMNAKDGGKWVLAVVDKDKSGGAEKEFAVTGLPTAVPYGKSGEMKSPGRMIGWGGKDKTRKYIDSVVKAYGGTPAPAPKPTNPTRPTNPVPTPPRPTHPAPKPPMPTQPTQPAPGADPLVSDLTSEAGWNQMIQASKSHPVVLRVHMGNPFRKHGATAQKLVDADGGKWTLVNADLPPNACLLHAKGIRPQGMPIMYVFKDGKLQGKPLVGMADEATMRAWVSSTVLPLAK